jgi:uncharacterized protein (DUF2461 family)
MTRDFADHGGGPLDPALKRTRWIVRRRLTGAEIASPDLPEVVAAFAADARPLAGRSAGRRWARARAATRRHDPGL